MIFNENHVNSGTNESKRERERERGRGREGGERLAWKRNGCGCCCDV
jgi:hypothetical protein